MVVLEYKYIEVSEGFYRVDKFSDHHSSSQSKVYAVAFINLLTLSWVFFVLEETVPQVIVTSVKCVKKYSNS